MFEKLVIVTRKTRLQTLIERFNTRGQAKFYLEHAGLDFTEYDAEDVTYRQAVDALLTSVQGLALKVQVLERALVSTYFFAPTDIVLAMGPDGLVANTAKYVGTQPLIGVNADPQRVDGTLLPFTVAQARSVVTRVAEGKAQVRRVTLAEARTSDGQRMLAFNDVFIGAQTHVSAVYRLRHEAGWERQSSSGVIISTGAGSTGWLSSVCTMTSSLARLLGGAPVAPITMPATDPRLFFAVREPFVSRNTSATQTGGWLTDTQPLEVESLMPSGGVIFSDGIESDALRFTSGQTVRVAPSTQQAHLVCA